MLKTQFDWQLKASKTKWHPQAEKVYIETFERSHPDSFTISNFS